MEPSRLLPSENMLNMSMALDPVLSDAATPVGNLTEVKVPVLLPVLSCVMIMLTLWPATMFDIVKVVLCSGMGQPSRTGEHSL